MPLDTAPPDGVVTGRLGEATLPVEFDAPVDEEGLLVVTLLSLVPGAVLATVLL